MTTHIYYIVHNENINAQTSHQLKSQCIDNFLTLNPAYTKNTLKHYPMGKPYIQLTNNKTLPISVSHTKNHFVMCFSDYICGIDIELKNRKINISKFKRWLNPNEIKITKQNPSILPQIWTIKESYTKLLGVGILKGSCLIDTVEDIQQRTLIKKRGNMIFDSIHLNDELFCTLAVYCHHLKTKHYNEIICL